MKKVLVTAGESNLGKAIRKEFENAGYQVLYTTTKPSEDRAAITVNLRDEKEVVEKLSAIGELNVLVNNAGIFTVADTKELTSSDFDSVFAVNVRGMFFAIKALLPALKKADGAIVNISSMNALHPGFGGTAHYDASKGAVSAYTASLAAETGLRVNAVAPGLIDAPYLKDSVLEKHFAGHSVKGRTVKAEEIAKIVLFLAESKAIYGQTILADNGYTLR
jgi:Dehydrogenases with different specificities (related to short-chain alcohol dehydrogenases)